MKGLFNKKTALILPLVAVFMISVAFFSLSAGKKAYAATKDHVIEADKLSFDGISETAKPDDFNYFQSGTDNKIIETSVNNESKWVKVNASDYNDKIYGGDNDALSIEIRVLFNRWPRNIEDTFGFSADATYVSLSVYNSNDGEFEKPLAKVEVYEESGNFVRILRVSPENICNNRGKLQDFVLRVDSDATKWTSSLLVDYVKIVFTATSGVMPAGKCISDENPSAIADTGVIWTKAEAYSDTYMDMGKYGGLYAYVDDPALVMLKKEKFPTVDCVTEEDGTETLLLKNAVFAFSVGNVSPEDYEQFVMDILLSDKRRKGDHTLYLYGSNTDKFVDESGNPVGYASKVTVKSYEQGFHNKFLLEGEDINKLAGADGKISYLYVLYHGNTLDTANETAGICNGSQIWVNKIQFLTESEAETPTVETEYEKYDISDIFPVGESVRIENKSGDNVGGVISNAVVNDKKIGELSFGLSMASGDNVALLFNAKGGNKVDEYLSGGILFYLSDGKIEISAHKEGELTKVISVATENAFTEKTQVKTECVPYYVNSLDAGYYCAVRVNGNVLLSGYFRNDNLDTGNAIHLCYRAKAENFSVELFSSKTEGVTLAKDLMNVKVKAEEIRYSFDKTDVPLSLSWYNTGFDKASELKCDGKVASVNQENRRVVFGDNGEVKISFSVTNAFGTFESNEFTLACVDVLTSESKGKIYNSAWMIALYFLPCVSCVTLLAILAVKGIKSAKRGEELKDDERSE